jgi:Pseudouridylate synthase
MTAQERRAYRIAYDGRAYHGFQRQPDVPTVEDALLDGLRALGVCDESPPGYAAASRTDAGVSALAQTVAFDAPAWLSPAALNSRFPEDIHAWACASVPSQFHATHDAAGRTYTYHLHAPETAADTVRSRLDKLAGEHDFHNLTPDETGTVRELSVSVERSGEFLLCRVRADGFPRQLVRRAVGLLEQAIEDPGLIDHALSPAQLTGPEGIAPAPAAPLVLVDVSYPSLSFAVDKEAATQAHKLFDRYRIERATGAKIAATLATGLESGE